MGQRLSNWKIYAYEKATNELIECVSESDGSILEADERLCDGDVDFYYVFQSTEAVESSTEEKQNDDDKTPNDDTSGTRVKVKRRVRRDTSEPEASESVKQFVSNAKRLAEESKTDSKPKLEKRSSSKRSKRRATDDDEEQQTKAAEKAKKAEEARAQKEGQEKKEKEAKAKKEKEEQEEKEKEAKAKKKK